MPFDTIISNATLYDGTGRPGFPADLAIRDGRIAEIGRLQEAEADRHIDGKGKILCPGFIDVHSHADTVIHWDRHERVLEPLLRQGITTFVGGNCGMGLAPVNPKRRDGFLSYLEAFLGSDEAPRIEWETMGQLMETLDRRGVVMNLGLLAPHGIMRIAAMGLRRGLPDHDELESMKSLLAEALDAGALGLSTGLQYFPGLSADEDELVALAKMLPAADAVFTSHLRSYTNTFPEAVNELVNIHRRSGARVQLSHLFWVPHIGLLVDRVFYAASRLGAAIYRHHKIPAPVNLIMRGKVARLDRAIRNGLPMGIDAMPTGSGFTHALAFFPPWSLEGTKRDILGRIADPALRQKIYRSIRDGRSVWPHRDGDTWSMNFFRVMGFRSVFLMSAASEANRKYVGMDFVRIGKARRCHPFDAVCDMLIEEDGHLLVFEAPTWPGDEFAERSVYAAIASPNVSIVTDAIMIGQGKASHLFYDCYPRILGKYVRREKLLSLGEAIRKCTSLPARQLGIPNRGEIKRGYWADLVLFDADKIDSRSTAQDPAVFPAGVEYVLVNGRPVVTPEGYHPDPRPGRVIRRGAA